MIERRDQIEISTNNDRWDWKSWLWVCLCSLAIFATVPIARNIQEFIYDSVGSAFFTYVVLATILAAFSVLVYLLVYKFKVRSVSQYLWLFSCAGMYIYFTLALRKYPEEAVHLLQYSLLSFFVFRALSYRVRDWTAYVTTVFIVLLAGISDEFIQWLMPGRYWGLNDVWINLLASLIFVTAVSKGIRPAVICEPANRYSLRILAGIVTLNLLFFGLCLSNTPDTVKRYTAVMPGLSWLVDEEPMTEFGYEHQYEAGAFISRMTLEEIKRIDFERGEANGKAVKFNAGVDEESELKKNHIPYSDRFMFEFAMHFQRRDGKQKEAEEAEVPEEKNRLNREAYAENLLLEKYFSNTLRHSGMGWSAEEVKEQEEKASLWKEPYTSGMYQIITFIELKTAWMLILGILALVWVPVLRRKETV